MLVFLCPLLLHTTLNVVPSYLFYNCASQFKNQVGLKNATTRHHRKRTALLGPLILFMFILAAQNNLCVVMPKNQSMSLEDIPSLNF